MPPHPIREEWDAALVGGDPLAWPGYVPPGTESVVTGRTEHYAFAEGRFDVIGGSMGAAHGERVVRAYRRAIEARLPMVVLTSSGGARMQEGMVALTQMGRCTTAAVDHGRAGLLSLAVYRSPTTGGVLASYASLVDARAARRGATLGFAGPRVVELTTHTRLPADSHTAEGAYERGLVDALLDADEEAGWIEAVLGRREWPLEVPSPTPLAVEGDDAWTEVQRARSPHRRTGIHWAALLASSWVELRGDDPTVRAGLATMAARRVVVVANDRYAGDGRPRPAGYRLARRAIALAAKLGLPLVTFVDTPGADPSSESESQGVAAEVARTFAAMAELPTVSVAVCVGEGGSGGALALAHADRLLIQEHAIFSVLAPEGAAAILERDSSEAPSVAARLKLTSGDVLALGVVDRVVADDDRTALAAAVVDALDGAAAGDRHRRADAVTARWVHERA